MNLIAKRLLCASLACAVVFICLQRAAAQSSAPLTSKELVTLVYQLPKHPELRDELVADIRKRGISFPLTDGMRSLVATKSGNDSLLRRTLEEAERRRVNPTVSTLPPEREGNELLERARAATLAAADAMPDFIVKQLIKRSHAFGDTNNWLPQDNLTIAVAYRANLGEQYKVLAVNGIPRAQETTQKRDYSKDVDPGTTSSGVEYISAVADVFRPQSDTKFKLVDTDLIQGRHTLVYEYEVSRDLSQLTLRAGEVEPAVVGSRGKIWIDRELSRVLRFEQIATEVPPDYPIRAASTLIDYEWVAIGENKFLLPTHSEILLTNVRRGVTVQSRNEIRFRGYQKFGAELKVIDEIDEKDFPPEKPEKP